MEGRERFSVPDDLEHEESLAGLDEVVVDPVTGQKYVRLTPEEVAGLEEAEASAARGESIQIDDLEEYIARLQRESLARVKGSGNAAVRRQGQ